MESNECNYIFYRIQEALSNLIITRSNIRNTNTMSMSDSGIGSLQNFSIRNNESILPSNLNILLMIISIILILSFLNGRKRILCK